VGLIVHALVDGVALGAAMIGGDQAAAPPGEGDSGAAASSASSSSSTSLGYLVFLAIMLHKAPSAFGLSSYLLHQGLSAAGVQSSMLLFSSAAPIGALATYGFLSLDVFAYKSSMLSVFLLFSGGTFLYVACAHILPEVQASAAEAQRTSDAASAKDAAVGDYAYDACEGGYSYPSEDSQDSADPLSGDGGDRSEGAGGDSDDAEAGESGPLMAHGHSHGGHSHGAGDGACQAGGALDASAGAGSKGALAAAGGAGGSNGLAASAASGASAAGGPAARSRSARRVSATRSRGGHMLVRHSRRHLGHSHRRGISSSGHGHSHGGHAHTPLRWREVGAMIAGILLPLLLNLGGHGH
jgi:hypothetical protein